jgi:hypothetical protein
MDGTGRRPLRLVATLTSTLTLRAEVGYRRDPDIAAEYPYAMCQYLAHAPQHSLRIVMCLLVMPFGQLPSVTRAKSILDLLVFASVRQSGSQRG